MKNALLSIHAGFLSTATGSRSPKRPNLRPRHHSPPDSHKAGTLASLSISSHTPPKQESFSTQSPVGWSKELEHLYKSVILAFSWEIDCMRLLYQNQDFLLNILF